MIYDCGVRREVGVKGRWNEDGQGWTGRWEVGCLGTESMYKLKPFKFKITQLSLVTIVLCQMQKRSACYVDSSLNE